MCESSEDSASDWWAELTVGGYIGSDAFEALRVAIGADAQSYNERTALEEMLDEAILNGPLIFSSQGRDGFDALEQCCERSGLQYRLRSGRGSEFRECTVFNGKETTLTFVEGASGVLVYYDDLRQAADDAKLDALIVAVATARDLKISATFAPELKERILPF